MAKGNIGVTTENIFPVIKKFLYSDHEIFLREMVSNAVDATQKLKTLAQQGDFSGELGDLTVRVSLDEAAKTITISDRGIGMTAEEIEKYINQIAFSGVTDFLDKYKDTANSIIGHFGLGFYSSFMVADKVEIITKSHKDAPAQRWSCDGSPEYELEETEKADRGTDIVLHISDDCKEFLDKNKLGDLLNKYCKFMSVPVAFGKETEWDKDKKEMVETDKDNVINSVEPLWTKTPSTLKEEDYKSFYRTLYPMSDEPLFWIHLNVDFPFNLTGILYFPKVKSNLELQRNKIQLYCNQVFVTDQVEGIVPDFLTLLHGVIDSPDIPLNVSRSYLQSDANVKKISTYITKKVADRLKSLFNENRAEFEEKWDSLKLFINYGMLSQEDFFDKAKNFLLFKDSENKFFTLEEYKTLIAGTQEDKDKTLVYLYATDKEEQYSYIEAAKQKGYSVLMFEGDLDAACTNLFEMKLAEGENRVRFVRVDSDTVDRLIQKEEERKPELTEEQTAKLTELFKNQLPTLEKTEFNVEVQALGEDQMPIVITQSEYMRRMKEMSRFQAGMSFYGDMADMFSMVLNADHPLVKKVESGEEGEERNKIVNQLIDLALLQNGMLKGEALSKFLKRSVELI